ncbi:sulfurtransferase-like selenium metabolism protein YedF [Chloroflexota bacterium]
MNKKVILVQSTQMGRGDDRLGQMLMASFLRLLGESGEKPGTIIFLNSGVLLLCPGSPVLEHVQRLEGQEVEILACTTCLEYFDLTDKLAAGKPTTMMKTIEAVMTADVVSL